MISGFLALVPRILMILLVVFGPAAAYAQEQSQPAAAEPAESEVRAESPEGAAQPQQGSLVVPKTNQGDDETESQPEPEPASSTGQAIAGERMYSIKKGDTLWDISNAFLKDPFLWPFIWKANPYITNADLIYPGDQLVIPDLAPIERAIQTPAGQEQQPAPAPGQQQAAEEDEAPVNRLILPEESPIPVIDKYSMLSAGFVSFDESSDVITGSPDRKTIMAYDDLAYVTIASNPNAAVGDRFLIYRPYNKVRHPVTGRNFGRLIRVLGVLQLIEAGKSGTFKARITLSFDAIERGSMLTPYQEPSLIYNSSEAKVKDISGHILEVVDTRTINGQVDILYLDKGSADGVEPGDRYAVYKRAEKKAYPKILIGEAQVFLVKERTSTAIVRKSTDPIAKGHMIEYKK